MFKCVFAFKKLCKSTYLMLFSSALFKTLHTFDIQVKISSNLDNII